MYVHNTCMHAHTNMYTHSKQRFLTCFCFFNQFRYLEIVRKLQLTYRMEPAGSQGVWNLDDYQFVPFIWGSSQLIGNRMSCVQSV